MVARDHDVLQLFRLLRTESALMVRTMLITIAPWSPDIRLAMRSRYRSAGQPSAW